MTVKELIIELQKMPQEARVFHLWDGEPRTAINIVYETKNGRVMTSDYEMVCYSTDARPKDAPTSEEDRYWNTPENPKGYTNEYDWDF
jgi:hypothetical protein